MKQTLLDDEAIAFITKIIFPAAVAIGIKSIIEMKKDKSKISLFNVVVSMFVGVGGAYIASDIVQAEFSPKYISVAIAIIAILTDKIAEFLIYKFNVDIFFSAFIDTLFDKMGRPKK